MKTSPSRLEYNRLWRLANRERLQELCRQWRLRNPERSRELSRRWRQKNPERAREFLRQRRTRMHVRKTESQYRMKRYHSDPQFRVTTLLRNRVRLALRGLRKSAATLELLGCSVGALRGHLEAQFRPGMTWENYGPVWHMDHVRPCASFNLADPMEQKVCFHYTNLQPLFAEENILKGAKI